MSMTVRIPTPLRRMTNGENRVEVDCASVGECITKLEDRFPGVKAQLLDELGELHRFVILYLNGEDIRFLQGTDTKVQSGDEISIVPAVAGG